MCSERETGADALSEALSLSVPQTALKLLNVQRQHNIETDLGLPWDPLLACADVMAQLLHADRLSAGPTVYCDIIRLPACNCTAV